MRTPKRSTQPEEGAALRYRREAIGVKQSELAEAAKLSQNFVSLLEAGKRNFTNAVSEKIYGAMKELESKNAERLTEIALNRDSRAVAMEELMYDARKKTPARELKRTVLKFASEYVIQRERIQALEEQVRTYQKKERAELEPLQAAWMERNVKPLTEKLTAQDQRIAEQDQQIADLHRLLALKANAVGMESQAQDLQEQIEQRVRKGKG